MSDNLHRLVARHEELSRLMARDSTADNAHEARGEEAEYAKLAREYAELSPIVDAVIALRQAQTQLTETESLLTETDDTDMQAMAEEERQNLLAKIPPLALQLKKMLLPKDEADSKNAILEVRAGTGGEEAALFAANLFRMYQRYAELHGWRFEINDVADTGLGGVREASCLISGANVFARLKFESGVHRVQRVPETEASGRIHTSAATVAVLPEALEIDIPIHDKDLRIDVFRSSGPGGQSVNTTDSAVRITHLPTGLVVQQQDEKSQHKNKAKAMKILRARLYDAERQRQHSERAADRKSQVGSGDRSERIRTYNFPQGRVTDHRINLSLYKIDKVMSGEALDEIIDPLITEDEAERLANAGAGAA
ncbi:MAG: peptide chain release factor 1 [Candidatus Symbiobacter sp.]|nr:peptide chain release factor 1 [Candidatus Symbiobacter sp.]